MAPPRVHALKSTAKKRNNRSPYAAYLVSAAVAVAALGLLLKCNAFVHLQFCCCCCCMKTMLLNSNMRPAAQ